MTTMDASMIVRMGKEYNLKGIWAVYMLGVRIELTTSGLPTCECSGHTSV